MHHPEAKPAAAVHSSRSNSREPGEAARGGRGVVARLSRRNPCDGRAAEIGLSTPDFRCQNSGLGSSCHDARDRPIHSGQEVPQTAPRPKACEHKPESKTGLACVETARSRQQAGTGSHPDTDRSGTLLWHVWYLSTVFRIGRWSRYLQRLSRTLPVSPHSTDCVVDAYLSSRHPRDCSRHVSPPRSQDRRPQMAA